MSVELSALDETLVNARRRLLDARNTAGHWEGELSGSASATAAAVFALHQVISGFEGDETRRETVKAGGRLVRAGLGWLALNQNADGGWGDTPLSVSDVGTTALCWAAFVAHESPAAGGYDNTLRAAERWLVRHAGTLDPRAVAKALCARYAADGASPVLVLTTCALAGRLGPGVEAWDLVPQFPFERAALSRRWHARVLAEAHALPALPALIAAGVARHALRPAHNPFPRALRAAARARALLALERHQADGGGFLDAAPLTAFVVTGLAAAGLADHAVARWGVEFLIRCARPDGSWPVHTNLATRLTGWAVEALASGADLADSIDDTGRRKIRDWLLAQPFRRPPAYADSPPAYADSPPGGWAWTDLPGALVNADDTAGALLALRRLHDAAAETSRAVDASLSGTQAEKLRPGPRERPADKGRPPSPASSRLPPDWAEGHAAAPRRPESERGAAEAGIACLLDFQEKDGAVGMFRRGPGGRAFDRAGVAAHALRAWAAWEPESAADAASPFAGARRKAIEFVVRTQRADGAWEAHDFGSPHAPGGVNLTCGTSRVLRAAFSVNLREGWALRWTPALLHGIDWLLAAQNPDGGWGGGPASPASVEETALAVESLSAVLARDRNVRAGIDLEDDAWTLFARMDEIVLEQDGHAEKVRGAVERGAAWLVARTGRGERFPPAPICLSVTKLWYFETLYPLIFTAAALGQARLALSPAGESRQAASR